jgi:hypothetical protein
MVLSSCNAQVFNTALGEHTNGSGVDGIDSDQSTYFEFKAEIANRLVGLLKVCANASDRHRAFEAEDFQNGVTHFDSLVIPVLRVSKRKERRITPTPPHIRD